MGDSHILFTMKVLLFTASVLISSILAQDTYHCPDGWLLEEDRSGCRCFLISGDEQVTKDDADILCAFHDGAWVAELDHPGINCWTLLRLESMDCFGLEPTQLSVTMRDIQESGS